MPLHVTGTRIAEYFRFACERQLRHALDPALPRPAEGGVRAGAGLLAAVGRDWERRKVRQVLRRFGPERVRLQGWKGGDAMRIPAEEVVALLREPGKVEVLVQPELRLSDPAAFARRYGLDPVEVEFGPAIPDLVRIRRRPDGSYRFQVVDIKASASARGPHYAQVAFYTLILEAICAERGITGGRVDRVHGRIWSRDGHGPRRFPLASYRHHVEEILRRDVLAASSRPLDACEWHLSARCSGCALFTRCRTESDERDDLAKVVGITPLARRVLHAKGVHTVRALGNSVRKDTFEGCYALESQPARLRQRALALSHGKVYDVEGRTHLMPAHEDVRVVLTAEGDPVSGRCFALGLRVESLTRLEDAPALGIWISEAGTAPGERAILDGLLGALGRVMAAVVGRPGGLVLHLYVYDRFELELLRALLLRHLDEADGRPRAEIAALLASLSPRAGGKAEAARSQPGTVVADVVSALFALPVPYAYDLAAVSERLRPAERGWSHQARPDYALPLSSQVAFERIHDVWRGGDGTAQVREEIHRTVASKLAAIDSVIRAIRERAARRQKLQMRKTPFRAAEAASALTDPLLESLRVFAEVEAAAERVALDALHVLPAVDRARRFECIRDMHLVERREDGILAFEFDPACRDAKLRVGDFDLLLTNDDEVSLLEADGQPWKRRALMVELVGYDLSRERPRVLLSPTGTFGKAEAEGWIDLGRVCVLDRAGSDFNTGRILGTLQALDAGRGEAADLLDLLRGRETAGWTPPFADVDAVAADLLPGGMVNPDQALAWRAALTERVSVIWGPPGTGKTYLLAWILIGMAAAAAREGRPFRVLVAASTHRAIVNVLARLAALLRGVEGSLPLRVVKLRGSGSEADAELHGSGVELVPDTRLPSILDAAASPGVGAVVVGSTVWSLWKQMRAAGGVEDTDPVRPWFDAVVIDEASQMKVAEALIAMSSMRAGAQVILCGDDRQLAPVLRGRYGTEAGSLLGSVFAHMAGHFPRRPLRESRRMNASLVAYPRSLFYPGLVSMVPGRRIQVAGEGRGESGDGWIRELFLRPDDAVVLCTYSGVRATARNDFEAHLAASIARAARDDLRDPETGKRYEDDRFTAEALAILAPHRAQNGAILGRLRALGLSDAEIPVVDTVERMQGNERDLIVVSYGVADREYAEAEAEFLLDPNRFNVSITRARSKLILLLSDAVLEALPADERVLQGSMAIKGYPAHCSDRVAEVELPAAGGEPVRATLRYRSLPPLRPALDTLLPVG